MSKQQYFNEWMMKKCVSLYLRLRLMYSSVKWNGMTVSYGTHSFHFYVRLQRSVNSERILNKESLCLVIVNNLRETFDSVSICHDNNNKKNAFLMRSKLVYWRSPKPNQLRKHLRDVLKTVPTAVNSNIQILHYL
jgi:hypothetical protein